MKKIPVLIVIVMLAAFARGEVYILEDDVMEHMFWINTDNVYRYSNQLLLPATVTDYHGNIITTDAMVTYDARWGNINLMHYGNYCILCPGFNFNGSYALIAQTSRYSEYIAWREDRVSRAYAPAIGFDEPLTRFAGNQDSLNPAERATAPAVSVPKTISLTSEFGHRYDLYDIYRIGDPIFEFYVCTMIAQTEYGPADGLLFYQREERYIDGEWQPYYLVIITVFATDWIPAYSMAGIYDPQDSSYSSHLFALIGYFGNEGTFTMVY